MRIRASISRVSQSVHTRTIWCVGRENTCIYICRVSRYVCVCMYVCIGVCIFVGCQDTFVYVCLCVYRCMYIGRMSGYVCVSVFYQHRSMRAIWYLACQNTGICKTLNDMYVYDAMVYTYTILWNM